jgi:hypothetical protein
MRLGVWSGGMVVPPTLGTGVLGMGVLYPGYVLLLAWVRRSWGVPGVLGMGSRMGYLCPLLGVHLGVPSCILGLECPI